MAYRISGFVRVASSATARSVSDITLILRRMEQGDPRAAGQFMAIVYDELRALAAAKMDREPAGLTLQPTALVHEAWLRLGGEEQPNWQSRAHFFGAAAEAMRRILIDCARRRHALRHGAGQQRAAVEELELTATAASDEQTLALDEALEKLTAADPKKAELVKLRYFTGLTLEEAAQTLGIAEPTARRWWVYARAWLHREIRF
jgi:RNA polymerase sigma factor (TIGR02999 family)